MRQRCEEGTRQRPPRRQRRASQPSANGSNGKPVSKRCKRLAVSKRCKRPPSPNGFIGWVRQRTVLTATEKWIQKAAGSRLPNGNFGPIRAKLDSRRAAPTVTKRRKRSPSRPLPNGKNGFTPIPNGGIGPDRYQTGKRSPVTKRLERPLRKGGAGVPKKTSAAKTARHAIPHGLKKPRGRATLRLR